LEIGTEVLVKLDDCGVLFPDSDRFGYLIVHLKASPERTAP
jgi:hypothetical protein